LTLSAKLRGLSPNDTLVLVNGKRRHGTGSLSVLGGPYQGGAAADLNFIPVNAIDHVEVLTDGAAAQYGTDAIAGVVNIILKHSAHGGNVSVTGGHYFDQGGTTASVTANVGLAPLGDKSWLNITGESRFHGHSDRGNPDPRVYNHDGIVNVGPGAPNDASLQFPGYPNVNHIAGDALYHLNVVSYDAGYDISDDTQVYSFGTYGHKNGQAFENYRTPGRAPSIWPLGFNPKEELKENDYAFTGGIKTKLAGWNLDLATTYGRDTDKFYTEGSANVDLAALGSTQTMFYDGKFVASQWTTNLDVTREFNVGLATPLTVAFGVEHRKDTYDVGAGEPSSYFGSGAQSFPGLTPGDAGSHSRNNTGVYGDLAVSPITGLKVDVAGRFEHFSDFGDTTVGKLTARYDFNDAIAVRGTVSTGFRAPTLAEEFYTNVNVGPTSAFGQLGPNSSAAKSLGINGLKPEKSDNFSAGLVFHPTPKLTATVDAYYIKLKDRIVGSGNIYGRGNPTGVNSAAVQAALEAFAGADTVAADSQDGIYIFANGLVTRSQGVEFVITDAENYGDYGRVDWSLSGAFSDTKITSVKASPASIAPQTLYDHVAKSILTDATPKYKVIGGALWTLGAWTVNLRETLYGKSSEFAVGDDGATYKTTIKAKLITDLEVDYKLDQNVRLTVGANNLLNTYPTKLNPSLVASYRAANDNAAVSRYPDWSPFGINGGYYYGKITYTF
ncbi:MAG: TonB-dependent receptor, partial [Phenylobacterium sp.]|nr:TonB-dependent receptor [Phenylobacterium sp.]